MSNQPPFNHQTPNERKPLPSYNRNNNQAASNSVPPMLSLFPYPELQATSSTTTTTTSISAKPTMLSTNGYPNYLDSLGTFDMPKVLPNNDFLKDLFPLSNISQSFNPFSRNLSSPSPLDQQQRNLQSSYVPNAPQTYYDPFEIPPQYNTSNTMNIFSNTNAANPIMPATSFPMNSNTSPNITLNSFPGLSQNSLFGLPGGNERLETLYNDSTMDKFAVSPIMSSASSSSRPMFYLEENELPTKKQRGKTGATITAAKKEKKRPRKEKKEKSSSSTSADQNQEVKILNEENNWFEMKTSLYPEQRKSYYSENRYLSPAPVVALKSELPPTTIKEGSVTVSLVDTAGRSLPRDLRELLKCSEEETFTQFLNCDGIPSATFLLKVTESSKGIRFRLKFRIKYVTASGERRDEKIYSNPFVVKSLTRRSPPPRSQS